MSLAALALAVAVAPPVAPPPLADAQPAAPVAIDQLPVPALAGQLAVPVPDAAQAHVDSAVPDIVVTGHTRPPPGDPAEALNKDSYVAVQAVDKAVVAPVAKGYVHVLPKPARDGVHNFMVNLDEPVAFVAYLLELKPGKAAETLGRFAINTTIGVGGLVDVAKRKPFNLPHRPNGLADALGYYGVGPGPYMFLPLFGPITVRDLVGHIADMTILPTALGSAVSSPPVSITRATVWSIDQRVQNDARFQRLRNGDLDPYVAEREDYLARRRAEIAALHGKPPPKVELADW